MEVNDASKYANANPGDILSDLPDEILSHILSFLHPKYAVRSSILSPRWKDVHKGVPNIKLSIDKYLMTKALLEKIATFRVKMSELQVNMREIEEDLEKLEESVQQSDTHDDDDDDDDDDGEEEEEEEDDDDDDTDDGDDDDEGSESE